MLKSELILRRIQVKNETIIPLFLSVDNHYIKIAEDLTRLIKAHTGRTRGELYDALREYEGDSIAYPVIRGLAAVLENRCTFAENSSADPVKLRTDLFLQGPVMYKKDPFSLKTREQIVAETADRFALTPQLAESGMFSDLDEEKILTDTGGEISPDALIARYNTEVARGVLYWAREVRITVKDNYKDIFKYIKLFKLMHTVTPACSAPGSERGYDIILHGPISPFVKATIRYGLQFAKFLPALMLCDSWEMQADIQLPGTREPLRYALDERSELCSHFKASGMFDSRLEADFATEFEEKYGGAKRVWELAREDEVIVVGDTVMIPDFSLTHRKDGRRALIEIVGFWHPQYLRRKIKKVYEAGRKDLILLIYESAKVAESLFEKVSSGEVLIFARKPVLKDVLAAVERCALSPTSGVRHLIKSGA